MRLPGIITKKSKRTALSFMIEVPWILLHVKKLNLLTKIQVKNKIFVFKLRSTIINSADFIGNLSLNINIKASLEFKQDPADLKYEL